MSGSPGAVGDDAPTSPRFPATRARCLLFFVLSLSASGAMAQEPMDPRGPDEVGEPWRWRVPDALTGLGVLALAPAPDGSVWFGTPLGVGRFDGIHKDLFAQEDGLPSEPFPVLAFDDTGRPWAASNRGVWRLEGGTWERVTPGPDVAWGVTDLAAAPGGGVWAATEWGLFRLGTGPPILYATASALAGALELVPDLQGVAVDSAPLPTPWPTPGSAAAGSTRTTPAGGSFAPQAVERVSGLGELWVAVAGGIVRMPLEASDGALGAPSTWRSTAHQDWGTPPLLGATLEEVEPGEVWLGTVIASMGLMRFRDGAWSETRLGSLGGSNINPSIARTPDGTIWVGGLGTLHRYRQGRWSTYAAGEHRVPSGHLLVASGPQGDLWIAGRGQQVGHFDPSHRRWLSVDGVRATAEGPAGSWFVSQTGALVRRTGDTWERFGPGQGLTVDVTAVVALPNGEVWVGGSRDGTAATAHLRQGEWHVETHPALSWSVDYRSGFVGSDGSVWFAGAVDPDRSRGQEGGLVQWNGRAWIHHRPPEAPDGVYGMAETSDGLWVAGVRGVHRFDGSRWERVRAAGLADNERIDALLSTSSDALWVGSRTAGVFRFDAGTWTRFGVDDGLPEDGLVDLAETPDGSLLGLTAGGLHRFDGRTWSNVGWSRGLAAGRHGQIHIDTEGAVWLSRVRPDLASGQVLNRFEPPFGFSAIRFRPNRESPDTWFTHTETEVYSSQSIRLAWGGTDRWGMTPDEDLVYSYRVGEKEWTPFLPVTGVTLDPMRPGRLLVQVRARDGDLNIDATPAQQWITVQARIWQRPWFRVLGSLVVVGIVILTLKVHAQASALRQANARLESSVEARTRELRQAFQVATREGQGREEALRNAEAHRAEMESLFEGSAEGVCLVVDGRVQNANRRMEELLDLPANQILGHDPTALLPGLAGALTRHSGSSGTEPAVPGKAELTLETSQGACRELLVSFVPVRSRGGERQAWMLAVLDITERVRRERQVRDLYRAAQDYMDREHSTLAIRIHDGVEQRLTALRMALFALRRDFPGAAADIAAIDGVVHSALSTARGIAQELKPGVLEELGLAPGLDWLTRALVHEAGPAVGFSSPSRPLPRLTKEVEHHVYRVGEEAIRNAVLHSGARRVDVSLETDGAEIELVVQDDGTGFTPDFEHPRHFGLSIMRERAAMVGGELVIEAAPGGGSRLRFRFSPPPPAGDQPSV